MACQEYIPTLWEATEQIEGVGDEIENREVGDNEEADRTLFIEEGRYEKAKARILFDNVYSHRQELSTIVVARENVDNSAFIFCTPEFCVLSLHH
jgi:hypothetical protein